MSSIDPGNDCGSSRWPLEHVRALTILSFVLLVLVAGYGFLGSAMPAAVPDPGAVEIRIPVNQAEAADLQLLPGIGPTLAERIVQERESGGLFTSVSDLQRVKGIGPKRSADVAPHVEFGPGDTAMPRAINGATR